MMRSSLLRHAAATRVGARYAARRRVPRHPAMLGYLSVAALVSVYVSGCSLFERDSFTLPDAGSKPAGSGDGCPTDFTSCGSVCCAPGKRCIDNTCQYPYSKAHLYVYLCPSFNMGCSANFFALDQTCSPIRSAQPGTCYDTGFEVAAASSYALASCQACDSGCGSPSSLKTPAGFSTPNYYSGFTWYCGTKCEAPPECGGHSTASSSTRCSTFDCWLAALSVRENAAEVPLVVVHRPAAPSSTAATNPAQTPRITQLNGTTTGPTTGTIALPPLGAASPSTRLEYEFSDPNGCAPGLCFSLSHCPSGVRCSVATTTVCSRVKQDGARSGAVTRTLSFNAQPADANAVELPLQLQPITGPKDPTTGACLDPFDDSDSQNAVFVDGALVGDVIDVRVSVSSGSSGNGSAGGAGRSATAGAGGSQVDCSCRCDNGRVCSSHADCGVDADGIPNVCGCPVGPPCR
jgi:hypothetical protein